MIPPHPPAHAHNPRSRPSDPLTQSRPQPTSTTPYKRSSVSPPRTLHIRSHHGLARCSARARARALPSPSPQHVISKSDRLTAIPLGCQSVFEGSVTTRERFCSAARTFSDLTHPSLPLPPIPHHHLRYSRTGHVSFFLASIAALASSITLRFAALHFSNNHLLFTLQNRLALDAAAQSTRLAVTEALSVLRSSPRGARFGNGRLSAPKPF